jgi:hypothetical protein
MERYEIGVDDEGNYCGLIPSENGSVVKYADAQAMVEALQAELANAKACSEKNWTDGAKEAVAARTLRLERDAERHENMKQLEELRQQVGELQREKDEAITTHRNIVKQFDELTCFIGCDYDPETETWVSGKPPYLSAGTNEVEACKAAVDALRSVAIVLQAALTPAGQRWTRERPTEPGWYWWRVSPNTCPDLVLLRKGGVGSEETVLCDVIGTIERGEWSFSDKRCCLLKDLLSGEWQGPLTPNEAT